MKLYIISGISRGLGKELALEVIARDYEVLGLGRSSNKELEGNEKFSFLQCDLMEEEEFVKVEDYLGSYDFAKVEEVVLINNAGTLGSLVDIKDLDYKSMLDTFKLNTIAPLMLVKLFIEYTEKYKGLKKKIINITSGAATRPLKQMSLYCSSKSAFDMLTKISALENESYVITAISPGMIETNMQEQLRTTDALEDKVKYEEAKRNGQVREAREVAKVIVDFTLEEESDKDIYHINELIK